MEFNFASRLDSFEEGIFATLNDKKNELVKAGRKVYNMSVGTPDFKPAQHIMDAVKLLQSLRITNTHWLICRNCWMQSAIIMQSAMVLRAFVMKKLCLFMVPRREWRILPWRFVTREM